MMTYRDKLLFQNIGRTWNHIGYDNFTYPKNRPFIVATKHYGMFVVRYNEDNPDIFNVENSLNPIRKEDVTYWTHLPFSPDEEFMINRILEDVKIKYDSNCIYEASQALYFGNIEDIYNEWYHPEIDGKSKLEAKLHEMFHKKRKEECASFFSQHIPVSVKG